MKRFTYCGRAFEYYIDTDMIYIYHNCNQKVLGVKREQTGNIVRYTCSHTLDENILTQGLLLLS